jgi:broad specificity phosphatase PhoE
MPVSTSCAVSFAMNNRTWYLVRHGETEWNAEQRMQGQFESRLNALGYTQAARSGETLAKLGVDHVFASPLLRVRQTLTEMAPYVALKPVFDDRLKEWSSGDWSGFLYADIARRWPAGFAAWEADRYHVRVPGGENFVDLDARAASFFAEHGEDAHSRIAIVAHGFINRALAKRLLGLTPDQTMDIRQNNDAIFRIRTGDGAPVADHFIGGEGPFPGLPSEASRPQSLA